tara:strand:+ start:7668 stop:7952 length:285 start_codon:yes stop_codon:yes gene_type:complete
MRHIENPMVLGPNPFELEGPDLTYHYLKSIDIDMDHLEFILWIDDEMENEHVIELSETCIIDFGYTWEENTTKEEIRKIAKKIFKEHYEGCDIE